MSREKPSAASVYELVAIPAALVVAGFVILRWVDGEWWGVLLWILLSPLLYVALDLMFFGRLRQSSEGDAKRLRSVKSSRAPSASPSAPAKAAPDWESARDVSTGAEILRRGRRYDRRG